MAGTDANVLVETLVNACASGAPIDFQEHTLPHWTSAIYSLFRSGNLSVAESAVRQLYGAYPAFGWAEKVCSIFDALPGPDQCELPFIDDAEKDVQVVPCENSDTVVLVFCDARHHFGFPLIGIHRWLGRRGVSVVYLRDFDGFGFLKGIRSLGAAREETFAALRVLTTSLGGRRVFCLGNSAGVLATLLYGLRLDATGVMGFAGHSSLRPELWTSIPTAELAKWLTKQLPEFADVDMRDLYAARSDAPRLCMLYGEKNGEDRGHAMRMAGPSNVVLLALRGYAGHDVVIEMIIRRQFGDILDWFLQDGEGVSLARGKLASGAFLVTMSRPPIKSKRLTASRRKRR